MRINEVISGSSHDRDNDMRQQEFHNYKEALMYLQQNRSLYATAIDLLLNEDLPILRNINGNFPGAIYDPRGIVKPGTSHGGFVNQYVSSSPDWKDYPPRNQSISYSPDDQVIQGYDGDPYVCLLQGNPQIGDAGTTDFWSAFSYSIPMVDKAITEYAQVLMNYGIKFESNGVLIDFAKYNGDLRSVSPDAISRRNELLINTLDLADRIEHEDVDGMMVGDKPMTANPDTVHETPVTKIYDAHTRFTQTFGEVTDGYHNSFTIRFRPQANMRTYDLKTAGSLISSDHAAELWCAGPMLAIHYYHLEELVRDLAQVETTTRRF